MRGFAARGLGFLLHLVQREIVTRLLSEPRLGLLLVLRQDLESACQRVGEDLQVVLGGEFD